MGRQVGEVLKELREALGKPRSEIARAAKLDPSVVWRLENPREGAQPSFELVRRVALALDASLDDVSKAIDRRQRIIEPTTLDLIDRLKANIEAIELKLEPFLRKEKKNRFSREKPDS